MDDRFNTIAGWTLGAGIVFLGAWLVTGEIFHSERPEPMGYPIAGVEQEGDGEEAERPIAFYLQTADAGRGQGQFSKCQTCHTINQGGANGLGPNLWGRMGAPIAGIAGFNYSDALRAKAGETWTWENMSQWIHRPRAFAEGTRMTFAGIADPQARADLLVYMNAQGGSLQIPPPPADAAGSDGADAPAANAAEAADRPAQGNEGTPQPAPDAGPANAQAPSGH